MTKQEITPKDCVHFSQWQCHTVAQSDIYHVLGQRAYELYRTFVSLNATEDQKYVAGRRFLGETGFHPQRVVEIIQNTNAWYSRQ